MSKNLIETLFPLLLKDVDGTEEQQIKKSIASIRLLRKKHAKVHAMPMGVYPKPKLRPTLNKMFKTKKTHNGKDN